MTETRDQSTGGLCSWAIRLGNGTYLYTADGKDSGFDIGSAYIWLARERPDQIAARWIGAQAVRSRP